MTNPMITVEGNWIHTLRIATVTAITTAEPAIPGVAAEGLRLAWTTAFVVRTTDPIDQQRWRTLREHIDIVSNAIEPHLGPPGVELGTGAQPKGRLFHSDHLLFTATALTSVSQTISANHRQDTASGVQLAGLARMNARTRATVEQVLREWTSHALDGLDRQAPHQPEHPMKPPTPPAPPGPRGPPGRRGREVCAARPDRPRKGQPESSAALAGCEPRRATRQARDRHRAVLTALRSRHRTRRNPGPRTNSPHATVTQSGRPIHQPPTETEASTTN
jgi:hypothetical protein